MEKYIMAIDQGTTSSRVILFNHASEVISVAQKEFTQYFPKQGWVEHDANEIWLSVLSCIAQCLKNGEINPSQVEAIGITNQRETTVVWNKDTGLPIYNAIVWQSRQTDTICDELKEKGYEPLFTAKTGLRIDPYFSATKIRWILDHVDGAKDLAKQGKLLAGTIDSWLIWCLSGNEAHVTDYTNASRTLLFNIFEKKWDEELCSIMDIPMSMLPEVKESSCLFAKTASYHFFGQQVPIMGVAGDQQAALFGQGCIQAGEAKNTYGTGCFLLMNIGQEAKLSQNGLVTTLACDEAGKPCYALEGSVFVAGSAIQWLRDQMQFFPNAAISEEFAKQANKQSNVIVVPAFTGLGAPYWDDKCRGAIFGLTRGTTREDITKATLDSLAYQTKDVLDAMSKDSGIDIKALRVDGGASKNNYLMQFQSDLLQCDILRPKSVETTEIKSQSEIDRQFRPLMAKEEANQKYAKWEKAVKAAREFD